MVKKKVIFDSSDSDNQGEKFPQPVQHMAGCRPLRRIACRHNQNQMDSGTWNVGGVSLY